LEPTHYYGQDSKSSAGASTGDAGKGEMNLLDMIAGPVNPTSQQ